MRPTAVVPNGRERTFGREEIIVSKTDLRGHITYANDVFLRVSGYREDEVLGRPHSLIRHPDMPRAVFQLLWDEIQAGREIFAYVDNLAATGEHYWVLAHVTPTFGTGGRITGYHSNRRSPDPAAVRAIEPLYRELRDEERRHPTGRAAVTASTALLRERLEERGVTYDSFVWDVIGAER